MKLKNVFSLFTSKENKSNSKPNNVVNSKSDINNTSKNGDYIKKYRHKYSTSNK